MASFSYAEQIQPLNGQVLNEATDGIDGNFRAWCLSDIEEYPQATNQVSPDFCLVVDKSDGSVWSVSIKEALAAGLRVDAVEVSEGEFIRTECF